ncbi:unnamed protein product [Leptosia nina]|uniref:Uncharacterized protein n=1 Tax=Leptosia nina TaxID=320188 RepID=A0AAV1IVW4_9NEOP
MDKERHGMRTQLTHGLKTSRVPTPTTYPSASTLRMNNKQRIGAESHLHTIIESYAESASRKSQSRPIGC